MCEVPAALEDLPQFPPHRNGMLADSRSSGLPPLRAVRAVPQGIPWGGPHFLRELRPIIQTAALSPVACGVSRAFSIAACFAVSAAANAASLARLAAFTAAASAE